MFQKETKNKGEPISEILYDKNLRVIFFFIIRVPAFWLSDDTFEMY